MIISYLILSKHKLFYPRILDIVMFFKIKLNVLCFQDLKKICFYCNQMFYKSNFFFMKLRITNIFVLHYLSIKVDIYVLYKNKMSLQRCQKLQIAPTGIFNLKSLSYLRGKFSKKIAFFSLNY